VVEDLSLTSTTLGFAVGDPTSDSLERMRNRFRVLFLSQRSNNRGSFFMSEMAAGRITTNSDIIGLFSLSAAQIITDMRDLGIDLYPYRAQLDNFTFESVNSITLDITLFSDEGNITDNIVVEVEE